jgi:hypothetical protein
MNQEFLDAYRIFEETLRNEEPSLTVYEYSARFDENSNDTKKLQLCRLTRNYLSHQPDSFITPTKEMVEYIQAQTNEILKKHKTAKDIMTKMTPITSDMKISEAAAKLGSKKPCLVVCDKEKHIEGLLTRETIRKAVADKTHSKTIKTAGGLEKPTNIVSINEPAENIKCFSVVTSDGTINGLYKGIVQI